MTVCTFWNAGNCKKSGSCRFEHPSEVCFDYQLGHCAKQAHCNRMHPTKQCNMYPNCSKGVRCRFRHVGERGASDHKTAPTANRGSRGSVSAPPRSTASRRRTEVMQLLGLTASRRNPELMELRTASRRKQERTEVRACCVCFEECRPTAGVSCAEMHFLCDGCFDRYVLETATRDDRLARGSDVQCPCDPCGAACFSDKQVAQHVSDETFAQLGALRRDLHEQAVVAQMKVQMEADMSRRGQLSVAKRTVADARYHIVENVLTLKCPKCKIAVLYESGCFALGCGGCSCQFCAWCLQPARDSSAAHRCAAECGTKHGADGYNGTKELFDTYHNGRKRDAAKAFLLQLDGALRAATLEACHSELESLGVGLGELA